VSECKRLERKIRVLSNKEKDQVPSK